MALIILCLPNTLTLDFSEYPKYHRSTQRLTKAVPGITKMSQGFFALCPNFYTSGSWGFLYRTGFKQRYSLAKVSAAEKNALEMKAVKCAVIEL